MRFTSLGALSLAALSLLMLGSHAHAVTLSGTFGFIPLGNLTANNNSLDMATSVTVPSSEEINTAPSTYLGVANAFIGLPGSFVTLSTTTVANTGSLGITFTSGTTTYTFTPSNTILFTGTTSNAGNFLTFSENGTISDGPTFVNQAAQLAGSFSQTAQGGAVNANFTFSTPPPPTTPEPGAIAMLVGVGVSSSAFVFRRRVQK